MINTSPFLTPPKQHTILHIDGDAFFASCEQALNPRLRNQPIVTGEERGIVSSMSYDAKKLGVTRGMPIWQLRKQFPGVIIVSSNFYIYEKFSDKIATTVEKYTPEIERYSIDEAFADLTGWTTAHDMTASEIADRIQKEIDQTLDISVSIGIGPSKVLAKVGSKHHKPHGLVEINSTNLHEILSATPIENIWGIGPRLAKKCFKFNIYTALDFIKQPFDLVRARFSMPTEEIWHELRGTSILPIITEHDEKQSLTRSHTFHPATSSFQVIRSEIIGNLERVLLRARRRNLLANTINVFLKTQDFNYHTVTKELVEPSAFTNELSGVVTDMCLEIFHPKTLYRTTGVTISNLVSSETRQNSLFTAPQREKYLRLYNAIDTLSLRHGRGIIATAAEKINQNK